MKKFNFVKIKPVKQTVCGLRKFLCVKSCKTGNLNICVCNSKLPGSTLKYSLMKKWLYMRVPTKWEGKIRSWISNSEVLFMCRDVKWKYNNLELNMDKTVLDTVLINVSRWNDIVMIRIYFKSFNLSQKLKLVNLCMASMCKRFSPYFVFTSRLKWTHWRASSWNEDW